MRIHRQKEYYSGRNNFNLEVGVIEVGEGEHGVRDLELVILE